MEEEEEERDNDYNSLHGVVVVGVSSVTKKPTFLRRGKGGRFAIIEGIEP